MRYHYVYILECSDDTLYVGQTAHLELRMRQHHYGSRPGSYTERRRPVELIWYELVFSREDAVRLERKLKGWSAKKKRAMIEERWEDLPLLAKCRNATSHEYYIPQE